MVHLNPESKKQFEIARSGITQFCRSSCSIRDGIHSYMDISLAGSGLSRVVDLKRLSYDICDFAAELTEEFGWRIPDREYRQMVRDKIAPLPPLFQWLYTRFLYEILRKYPSRQFLSEYLGGIDRTYHIREFVLEIIRFHSPHDNYADLAEQVIQELHSTPLAAAILLYGHEPLAEGDPIAAAIRTVEHLESDVLQLAQIHAIEIASLYTAAALERLEGVPSRLTMEGLKFFYLASEEPSDLYTGAYLQKMDDYEIPPCQLHKGLKDSLLGLFQPRTNQDVFRYRLRTVHGDYRSESIPLPKAAPGTVFFQKRPYYHNALPESMHSQLRALAGTPQK